MSLCSPNPSGITKLTSDGKRVGEQTFCARLLLYIPSLFAASCLEHLLDNGADPSMVNSKGYSAVHYAAYHGNKQNLELVGLDSQ